MKTRLLISVTLLLLGGLSACTNKGVYEGLKQRNELECRQVPDAEYEDCMRSIQKDYETYQEERGEVNRDRY
jgi:hypothetical protein